MNQFNFRSMASSEASSALGSPLLAYGQRKPAEQAEAVNALVSKPVEKYTRSLTSMVDVLKLSNAFMLDNLEQNVKSNELLNKILHNMSETDSKSMDIPGLPVKLKQVASKIPNKYKIGFVGAAMALGAMGIFAMAMPTSADASESEEATPEEVDQAQQLDEVEPQDIQPVNDELENTPESDQEAQSTGGLARPVSSRAPAVGGLARPISSRTQTGSAIRPVDSQRIRSPSLTSQSSSDETPDQNKDLKISARSIVFSSDNFVIDQGDSSTAPAATGLSRISMQMTDTSSMAAPPGAQFASTVSDSQTDQSSGGLVPPVNGRVSSGFGQRARGNHEGIDFAVPVGTPVLASTGGVVVYAGERGNYGNLVTIQSPDGIETRYAHLSAINVAKGDAVTAGQEIAKSGNTGLSTGPHLHFEVRKGGTPIDPKTMLGSAAQIPGSGNEMPGEPSSGQAQMTSSEGQSASMELGASASRMGSVINDASTANLVAESTPPQVSVSMESTDQEMPDMGIGAIQTPIDPNDPGPVGIDAATMREFFGELMA